MRPVASGCLSRAVKNQQDSNKATLYRFSYYLWPHKAKAIGKRRYTGRRSGNAVPFLFKSLLIFIMGYNLYITRALNWYDARQENQISLEEWGNYVANDPEMRFDNYASTDIPGQDTLEVWEEGLSVWTAYSEDGLNGNHAWFYYSNGNIIVKNPDDEIIGKMLMIAEAFHGKVQGDEGELYEENDFNKIVIRQPEGSDNKITPPPASPRIPGPMTRKPWWKFW